VLRSSRCVDDRPPAATPDAVVQQGAPPRCSAVCRMVLKNTQALGSFAELRPFARGPSDYNNDAMVYTYIDLTHASRGLSKASSAMDMIALWASSWARHGWTPRLLTREDVERDPGYRAFERLANETATMVSKSRHGGKTTSADSTFRLRGLTQFYAKAVAGAGVLTDSDTWRAQRLECGRDPRRKELRGGQPERRQGSHPKILLSARGLRGLDGKEQPGDHPSARAHSLRQDQQWADVWERPSISPFDRCDAQLPA
jgi:hypothetical protein